MTIKQIYDEIEQADYNKKAELFLEYTKARIQKVYLYTGKHFNDDTTNRDVYTITIYRGNKKYTFLYGDSICNTKAKPDNTVKWKPISDYSILSCLTKNDPGNIQDFMDGYGYNIDSKKYSKLYEDVCEEYNELRKLFTSQELELMDLIH